MIDNMQEKLLSIGRLADEINDLSGRMIDDIENEEYDGYITFPEGNRIFYSQDMGFKTGMPPGVRFRITVDTGYLVLTAPGYGDRKDYGNGSITISVGSTPGEVVLSLKRYLLERSDELRRIAEDL